jgi:hypothetical protein
MFEFELIITAMKKFAEAINDTMFKTFRYNGTNGNATKIICIVNALLRGSLTFGTGTV